MSLVTNKVQPVFKMRLMDSDPPVKKQEGKSPLEPVTNWLRYLKLFGGFPLEVADSQVTEFVLSVNGMFHVAALYFVVIALVASQQFAMHSNSLDMVVKVFKSQGMSNTDIYSFYFGMVPQFAVLAFYIIIIVSKRKALSDLCHHMVEFIDFPLNEGAYAARCASL